MLQILTQLSKMFTHSLFRKLELAEKCVIVQFFCFCIRLLRVAFWALWSTHVRLSSKISKVSNALKKELKLDFTIIDKCDFYMRST